MKPLPRLKRYISIYLGAVFLAVIIAYTLLVYYSQFSGIIEAGTYDLRLAARDFAVRYENDSAAPMPSDPRMTASIGEAGLPDWLKKTYSPGRLAHDHVSFDEAPPEVTGMEEMVFFVSTAYDLHDGKRLYLVKIYPESDDIPGAFRYSEKTEILVLSFGVGFIILTFLCVRFLFRKVAESVKSLSAWASDLTREKMEMPRPKLKFREIDQLAGLIENAVGDLHRALTREHQFLRNASHELRTPIAVLRTNMDLLERLRLDLGDQEKAIYPRLRRAVDDMHRLTETLLWLSRKEETMPEPENVSIGEMVDELVRENRYLLKGKDVDLGLDIAAARATLPAVAVRIALGNLIRNAFQYTGRGSVEILVAQDAVTITNRDRTMEKVDSGGGDYGFGLMLVRQISEKLNLQYEDRAIPGGHRALSLPKSELCIDG